MDFKEIISFTEGVKNIGYPAGIIYIIVVLIKCIYGYLLRRTPIEETRKYIDGNGNPVETTKKFRN